jgi:hypothetical protein
MMWKSNGKPGRLMLSFMCVWTAGLAAFGLFVENFVGCFLFFSRMGKRLAIWVELSHGGIHRGYRIHLVHRLKGRAFGSHNCGDGAIGTVAVCGEVFAYALGQEPP